jgi:ferrous iron transport protein B
VVTNRWLALPIFALVMFAVYYISVTTIGTIVTDFTNDTLFGGWITEGLTALFERGNVVPWLTGLVIDGIVGGVGAVIGFVPQMLVLFFLLALLEDVGYMARVAFIMDRIFRKFGLSGKSFIPMLISSGCGVPGIMASRTIENQRDRRMTIMTTTFIPCGAKMPIIALFAGAISRRMVGGSVRLFIGVAAVIVSDTAHKDKRCGGASTVAWNCDYHTGPQKVFRSTWTRWSFIKGRDVILSSAVCFGSCKGLV